MRKAGQVWHEIVRHRSREPDFFSEAFPVGLGADNMKAAIQGTLAKKSLQEKEVATQHFTFGAPKLPFTFYQRERRCCLSCRTPVRGRSVKTIGNPGYGSALRMRASR